MPFICYEKKTFSQDKLDLISKAMSPGGYCAVTVPNRDSKALQKAGVNWGWLQEPYVHVSCMSIESIRIPSSIRRSAGACS